MTLPAYAQILGFTAILLSFSPIVFARLEARQMPIQAPTDSSRMDKALVILSTEDQTTLDEVIDLVESVAGRVDFSYPPSAFEAILNADAESLLKQHSAILKIERGVADTILLKDIGSPALSAARTWNTVVQKQPNGKNEETPPGPVDAPPGGDVIDPTPEELIPDSLPRE